MEIFLDNDGWVSEQTICLTDMNHAFLQHPTSDCFTGVLDFDECEFCQVHRSTDLSGETELLLGAG